MHSLCVRKVLRFLIHDVLLYSVKRNTVFLELVRKCYGEESIRAGRFLKIDQLVSRCIFTIYRLGWDTINNLAISLGLERRLFLKLIQFFLGDLPYTSKELAFLRIKNLYQVLSFLEVVPIETLYSEVPLSTLVSRGIISSEFYQNRAIQFFKDIRAPQGTQVNPIRPSLFKPAPRSAFKTMFKVLLVEQYQVTDLERIAQLYFIYILLLTTLYSTPFNGSHSFFNIFSSPLQLPSSDG